MGGRSGVRVTSLHAGLRTESAQGKGGDGGGDGDAQDACLRVTRQGKGEKQKVTTAGVLMVSGLFLHIQASATLPSPQGVTMQSLNTQYVLKWTWPHGSGGNRTVTFAAQYMPLRSIPTRSKFKLRSRNRSWSTVCENITDTQCDFSDSDLYYFGIYLLRVRASREKENSDWVQQEFCPDKDANLGPPSNVEVTPANNGLTVNISDPLTSKHTSMKDYLAYMYYSVQYWKHSTAERKVRSASPCD
ncbi:hypothetical protein Z043_116607, partial [Scleropages formosus]